MLPNLTVLELVVLQASFYEDPLAPHGALDLVGLESKSRTISSELSGGQLQRLAIALALVGNPRLVLLDEPTTGLDPAARRDLWGVLEGLRAEGKAVLLTTHYMEEAETLCDRVAILDRGAILAIGSVSELASDRGTQRVVFATHPAFDSLQLSRIAGVTEVVSRNGSTTLLSGDTAQTLAGVVDLGRSVGRLPEALTVRRPSLEEIYLELTRSTPTGLGSLVFGALKSAT
jgi:ABC-2 type transport system ATP-binding protein